LLQDQYELILGFGKTLLGVLCAYRHTNKIQISGLKTGGPVLAGFGKTLFGVLCAYRHTGKIQISGLKTGGPVLAGFSCIHTH
jgi:hypothetical protein